MLAQRRQLRSLFGEAARLPADGAGAGQVIQRKPRNAHVTWAITHLVKVQGGPEDESLFGKDADWRSGEIPPQESGQLSQGQLIIVDDEAVFMSRRGANQEDAARRKHDAQTDELKHKWLKVLAVWVEGGFKSAPPDAYVRAETIQLIDVPKPPQQDIGLREHEPEEEETVSADLRGFHDAWQQAAAKRRRSIGRVNMEFADRYTSEDDYITSGWNWDKFDEGLDVSEDIQIPEERTGFEPSPSTTLEAQHVFSANYTSGPKPEPVAYMVLEVRHEGDESFMYIRWLIAHPERGGGGSALVRHAIQLLNTQNAYEELRVESAFSAVAWYESFGFKKVNPTKNVVAKGVGYADTQLVYRKD